MITVIIAGGSGTRLWPLSTNEFPKHLLSLVDNESLLQSTYGRAKRLSEVVYVVTGRDHLHHVKDQLPELADDKFIVEPDRRDTAGCFLLALDHLKSRHDTSEPIAFIHADHFIRDVQGFADSFEIAQEVSQRTGRITLVGVEPTHPATGFGYIQKDGALEGEHLVHNVMMFKEKPEFEVAREYVRSGEYLWNAGYFIGSIDTFLRTMDEYAPELKLNYDKITSAADDSARNEAFLSFEKVAIDYALMEKTKDLLVVPAAFDWMDLGSFADAHTAVESDQKGNYIFGKVELDTVENSYIRNEEDKPVGVIGLDNVVVVNTPHGILVARKDLAQNVKAIAQKFQSQDKS